MNKTFSVTAIVTMLAISSLPMLVGAGERASDIETVKQQQLVIPRLHKAVTVATGYAGSDLEVQSTAHQITAIVINNKLNSGTRADRTSEASKIISAIAQVIADKPEFKEVEMIHIDYIKRKGKHSQLIQGIDFNKVPNGTFQIHLS